MTKRKQQIAPNKPIGESHKTSPERAIEPDQDIRTLLGFLSWHVDDTRDVTDEEADYILRQPDVDNPSADQRDRIQDNVLRQYLVDTTALETITGAAIPAPNIHHGSIRPSFLRRCKDLKRIVRDVAREIRLDEATLYTLDRGHAHTVPLILVTNAARALPMSPEETARCFAPFRQDLADLAAHRRAGGKPDAHAMLDFLEIINKSGLSSEDKQYWRDVVHSEKTGTRNL